MKIEIREAKVEPPPKEYVLILTPTEALALRLLTGYIGGPLFNLLGGVQIQKALPFAEFGVESSHYDGYTNAALKLGVKLTAGSTITSENR